jgi:hypothetical protein
METNPGSFGLDRGLGPPEGMSYGCLDADGQEGLCRQREINASVNICLLGSNQASVSIKYLFQ